MEVQVPGFRLRIVAELEVRVLNRGQGCDGETVHAEGITTLQVA